MHNVARDKGLRVSSHSAEFEAFDNLPKRIKEEMRQAVLNLSAEDVLSEFRRIANEHGYSAAQEDIIDGIRAAR